MKYKMYYRSASLNFQKTSIRGFLFKAQKTKIFDNYYCTLKLKEQKLVLKNVHEEETQVIKFEQLQYITTGEKIASDVKKQRWIHYPKNAKLAAVMFFIQLSETSDGKDKGIKTFQELVETRSERVMALRASSFRERQVWVEIIGSLIYLNLIKKIEQTNKPGNKGQIDWKQFNFFSLLDKVDYERLKLTTKVKTSEADRQKQEETEKLKAAVEKARIEVDRQKQEFLVKKKAISHREKMLKMARQTFGMDEKDKQKTSGQTKEQPKLSALVVA